MRSLLANRTVKAFDISGNRAGAEMLHGLSQILMTNPVIETVKIEDNDIIDMDSFLKFFRSMKERGKPFMITWPAVEIERMVQYGTATDAKVREARKLYEMVLAGSGDGVAAPDETEVDEEEEEGESGGGEVAIMDEPKIALPSADVL
jgi:hypothetical protein